MTEQVQERTLQETDTEHYEGWGHTSLVVQWFRLYTSNTRVAGLIPG